MEYAQRAKLVLTSGRIIYVQASPEDVLLALAQAEPFDARGVPSLTEWIPDAPEPLVAYTE